MKINEDELFNYRHSWNLTDIPFSEKTCGQMYLTESIREALRWLTQVCAFRSMMLLHADNGIGKSALCKYFLQELESKRYCSVYLPHSTLSGAGLLSTLVTKLGGQARFRRHQNLQCLEELFETMHPKIGVIVLDEAQNYAPYVLEELRQLTGLNQGMNAAFALILAGDSYLLDTLRLRSQKALLSRIALNYGLKALTAEESSQYIEYCFRKVGLERAAIEASGKELLIQAASGVMRSLNLLGRLSWVKACQEAETVIRAKHVREALDYIPCLSAI